MSGTKRKRGVKGGQIRIGKSEIIWYLSFTIWLGRGEGKRQKTVLEQQLKKNVKKKL